MGTITRDCPHCHSVNMTFTAFSNYHDPNTDNPKVWITAFYCGGCHRGYFADIAHRVGHSPKDYPGNIDKADGLKVLREYPESTSLETPQYLPPNIESFYIQAAQSLERGNLDASAMMARKVLEVAVKNLNPGGSGKLYQRIEQLHELGKITDDLKDWAHIIRDDGNEATHEEHPVSAEFSDELLSFAELFLMYTFTMPGMVAEKKGSSEESA